jgi:hypothetical protein
VGVTEGPTCKATAEEVLVISVIPFVVVGVQEVLGALGS